jgi:catechol 2,3-dioxygenase-like lactoylglutathione lyase family enzyme
MAKVSFGNHASVQVPLRDRASILQFYCDVLGGQVTKADPERDFVRLGDDFYIVFFYGDVPDESEFLRSSRAPWLELKSDDVEATARRIRDSGLARKLDIPDPHFYFQAPGGQCLRLVGVDEDLSFYEGGGAGPDLARVKEALRRGV